MLQKINQDIEQGDKQVYVYEAQLQGIRCTGCRDKIVENMKNFLSIQNISINIIAEKALISILNPDDITEITQKIRSLGFKVISDFSEISLSSQNNDSQRKIYFQLPDQIDEQSNFYNSKISNHQEFINTLKNKFRGIVEVSLLQNSRLISIKYNYKVTKGSEIYEYIKNICNESVIQYNPYIESFKRQKIHFQVTSFNDVCIAFGVMLLFLLFTMVFPHYEFFQEIELYPYSMSVISLYVIAMLSLTIFTMLYFGRCIFMNAFYNYYKYRMMNMETLVAIGCFSSLILTVFLILTYLVEESQEIEEFGQLTNDQKHNRAMKISELVHMMETASLILAIITLGKYQEGRVKKSILNMTEQLFPENELLQNTTVTQIEPKNKKFDIDQQKDVEVSYLDRDDFILIKAPFRLLNDVTIVHNISAQLKASDQIMYGQNDSFVVQKGQVIRSGAEIVEGEAIAQINNPVEQSLLYQTIKQLNLAQNNSEASESGISGLLKKLSEVFVKIIIAIALLTLLVWTVLICNKSIDVPSKCIWCFPIERFISVLVASCPCALGLAIPSVIATSLNLAMKNSILIKKNTVFEKISKIKAIVFDKTGTLFTKANRVDEFNNLSKNLFNDDQIWQIIYQLEKNINHPLAELLYMEAVQRECSIVQSDYQLLINTRIQSKYGISGELLEIKKNNKKIKALIGNLSLMKENNVQISTDEIQKIQDIQKNGNTVILMSINQAICCQIVLHNTTNLRPEAKQVVDFLINKLNKEVYILSGDSKDTVYEVGKHLGIKKEYLIGECDSQGKKDLLISLRENQKKEVMMVGDGLNDILSLEEACLGVSINAKSELNLMASDIVVLNENLWRIVYIFQLVKRSKIFIYINLFWAFSYNFFMIPLAAGCFCGIGLKITPLVSTIAMSSSSILVVLFSSFMKCCEFKYPKNPQDDTSATIKTQNLEQSQIFLQSDKQLERQIILNCGNF